MEAAGKKVLVFGLGKSGIGAGALLEKRGAAVILYDGNPNLDTEAVRRKVGEGQGRPCVRVDAAGHEDKMGELHGGHGAQQAEHQACLLPGGVPGVCHRA